MSTNFKSLVAEALTQIDEIFPWDLEEELEGDHPPVLVDTREAEEYEQLHIEGSIFAPRGILETCCDWGYAETIPELAKARDKKVVVICRSGNRSALAAVTMKQLGYTHVLSLQTGVRGWNDADLPLVNIQQEIVDADWAEAFLSPEISEEQFG